MHSDLKRQRNLTTRDEKTYSSLLVATWTQPFLLLLFVPAEMVNIEQTKKIIPLITREITFGLDVCDLVFGVNVTNLEFLGPN